MADIEPPSFSLGLDIDPEPDPAAGPTSLPASVEDEEDFGLQVMDSEEEEEEVLGNRAEPDPARRMLKRLRRGPARDEDNIGMRREKATASVWCDTNWDDEIEEFSSQEDLVIDAHPSTHIKSVCSSSKVPLRGSGVLTTQSSNHWKAKEKEQVSDAPASSSLEMGKNGLIFPKLTISPLRRFQLIDSDSDSDSDEPLKMEVLKGKSRENVASLKAKSSTASEQTRNKSSEKQQSEDLWKDFLPMKSFRVSTPVLDEVCDEYFQSLQKKNIAQKQGSNDHKSGSVGCQIDKNSKAGIDQFWNVTDHFPPAHLYFFHEDPRIRTLVRSRLPNFSPLATATFDNRGHQQPNESAIDYFGQFNGKASKPEGTKERSSSKGSTRGRKKPEKSNAKKTSQGWVDPRSSAAIPKDVGKRRVHANGQAAGHWYTSEDGRKVYVSRSGQELSGQGAYRCYRKESGGLRKSKKKTNTKRKKARV